MAWITPITWAVNTIITRARLNGIRDSLRYLKGLDGPVITENSVTIQGNLEVTGVANLGTASSGALRFPILTTSERDVLTPANGWAVYNLTSRVFQRYEDGAWVDYTDITAMVSTAPQGAIPYVGATGNLELLNPGSVGGFLQTQGSGSAPSWVPAALASLAQTRQGTATDVGISPSVLGDILTPLSGFTVNTPLDGTNVRGIELTWTAMTGATAYEYFYIAWRSNTDSLLLSSGSTTSTSVEEYYSSGNAQHTFQFGMARPVYGSGMRGPWAIDT